MTYAVAKHSKIEELPGWDALDPALPLGITANWLRCYEHQEPTYLWLTEDGAPRAAASCYLASTPGTLLRAVEPPWFLPEGADASSLFPFLMVGPAQGFSNKMIVAHDLAPEARATASRELISAIREQAAQKGATSIWFQYLPRQEAERLAAQEPSSHVYYAYPEAALQVRTLDEYLASFRNHGRHRIQGEMGNFEDEGLSFKETTLTETIDTFARLQSARMQHYGVAMDAERARKVFERWATYNNDRCRVISVVRGDQLFSQALFVRHGATEYGIAVATADDAPKRAGVYFNSVFYEPLRRPLPGVTEIHYGQGALDGKVMRGAHVRPLWNVVIPVSPLAEATRAALRDAGLARIKSDFDILDKHRAANASERADVVAFASRSW